MEARRVKTRIAGLQQSRQPGPAGDAQKLLAYQSRTDSILCHSLSVDGSLYFAHYFGLRAMNLKRTCSMPETRAPCDDVAVGKLPVVRADDSGTELNSRLQPLLGSRDRRYRPPDYTAGPDGSSGSSGGQTTGRPTRSAIEVPSTALTAPWAATAKPGSGMKPTGKGR